MPKQTRKKARSAGRGEHFGRRERYEEETEETLGVESAGSGRYPLDNLTYDLVAIVHEKSKALEAYDKYIQDARGDDEVRRLLEQVRESDVRMIEELRRHVLRLFEREGRRAA